MPIPIEFTKARAEHLIACLNGGKPIAPEGEDEWTGKDMLFVAGACFSAQSARVQRGGNSPTKRHS